MSFHVILSIIIIGIYFGFAAGQIFIFIVNRRRRAHFYMAILGLSSAVLLGVSLASHTIQDIEKTRILVPFQVGTYLFTLASLITVIHSLNSNVRKIFFWSLMGYVGILFIANALMPYGIIYESIDDINVSKVLGWEGYILTVGTPHSFYIFLAVTLYVLVIVFIGLSMMDLFRQKKRIRSYTFGSILIVYILSNLFDTFVDLGFIRSIYLTEYLMFPIILSLYADIYLELHEGRFFTARYQEVQKNFSTLIENVELFIVGIDLTGEITYVNRFFEQKLEVKPREVIGHSFYKLFLKDSDHQEYKEVMSSIESDKEIKKVEFQLCKKGVDPYEVSWSIVPIKSNTGEIIEILGVGTDVTEQFQTNSRLSKANTELKDLARQLEDENSYLKMNLKEISPQGNNMIGESDTMKYVFHSIDEVAKTESTVLIEGETGVGKELVARLVHDKSNRFDKPFIKVNCGALPKDLIESELFGHVKGAFTGAMSSRKGRFELADGGTIFLDEIGELPLELQAKLLRVLENSEFNPVGSEKLKRVDVRIVAATNRNLKAFAAKGGFRSDLYYRLSVFPITVPPLRNRKEDIPLLVEHFLISYCKKLNIDTLPVNISTMKKLQSYSWPGNVRELKNVIERSVISSMNRGRLFVDKTSLKEELSQRDKERKTLIEVEREYILSVLNETGWKISGKGSTSSILDVNEATLRSKMKRLGISKSGVKSV